jgi:hypothetical protein
MPRSNPRSGIGLPMLGHTGQCTRKAKPDALWISSAQIALEDRAAFAVEPHDAERAGRHAHLAADATVVVDHHPTLGSLPENSLPGTHGHTGGVITMPTDHRQVEPRSGVTDQADARQGGIRPALFHHGANQKAHAAAGAATRVYFQQQGKDLFDTGPLVFQQKFLLLVVDPTIAAPMPAERLLRRFRR